MSRAPAQHGTCSKYNRGCRCVPCTEANRVYKRDRRHVKAGGRPRGEIEHGTIGCYTNHKCRCDACMAAWRLYRRAIHAARRIIRERHDAEYREIIAVEWAKIREAS